MGIPLIRYDRQTKTYYRLSPDLVPEDERLVSETSSGLSVREYKDPEYLSDEELFEEEHPTPSPHTAEEVLQEQVGYDTGRYFYRVDYADPWKILAARAFYRHQGMEPCRIYVWNADNIRITDPIPPKFLGKEFEGLRNRIRFPKIRSTNAKMFVLMRHTYWGKALVKYADSVDDPATGLTPTERKELTSNRAFCATLRRRIYLFLDGANDPTKSKEYVDRILGADRKSANKEHRAERFLQMLRTVDGCFVQRYLAFPEEKWDWSSYDSFVLIMINFLLTDEFYDGSILVDPRTIETSYDAMKAIRKSVKLGSHTKTLPDIEAIIRKNPALRYWRPMVKNLMGASGKRYTQIMGILSQKRGCGTPPDLVALQAKVKFIFTVSEVPRPLSQTEIRLVEACMDAVLRDIPDHAFTGLATKGRISVTPSACLEYTRREGGTVQGIQDIVRDGIAGRPALIRDLETGAVVRKLWLDQMTAGEYIFWRSLDEVLKTPPEELKTAFVVVVKEPGKGRTVTKGLSYLKVVFDFVGRICSWPLRKGLESSRSGLGKANQAWQFFKLMMAGHESEIFFYELSRDVEDFADHSKQVTEIYDTVFMSSTDYETATDCLNHEVARIIGDKWMRRCGIPRVLRSIISQIAYRPRTILFHASGWIAQVGEAHGEDRAITLRQGVLMGDPMTKPVLHLLNACIRQYPKVLKDFGLLRHYFTNASEVVAVASSITPSQG